MTSTGPIAEQTGHGLPEGYLEIYELAVEMADRVSSRRLTTGALPVSGALAALTAVHGVDRVLLASIGVLLAVSWGILLRTYVRLTRVKFQIIHEMEGRLPVALYNDESRRLRDVYKSSWARITEYGKIEAIVPAAFGLFFAVVLIEAIID